MRPLSLLPGLLALPFSASQGPSDERYFPSSWATGGPDWDDAIEQARDFVSQLTLAEKVNLTTGTGWESDRCVGVTGSVPRLDFRGFCLQDGPLGVRFAGNTSAFPTGLNAATTFSRSLFRARGSAIGSEFYGKGVDVALGPSVGPLGLFPAGGRNWEGFGPDPYLAGVAVGETVEGMQGEGIVACVKHYILNEQEHYRGSVSSELDDRVMHEVFLWPFADAVRAGVGSVMCSYNRINGTYSCENGYTNHLLKHELGFQGFLVSDWGAQHSSRLSALAGLDMTMPGSGPPGPYPSLWGGALTEAVLAGSIPQWRLDDMAVRIMAAYFKVHAGDVSRPDVNFSSWTNETEGPAYFSANASWGVINEHVDVQADHAGLIREIGAKSVVLLKNDGALPLGREKLGCIAVIGEDAQDNPDGPNACVDRACNNGTLAMGWGSGTADFPYLVSPAAALRERVATEETAFLNVESNWDLKTACEAAAAAEVALVFANANAGENYVFVEGNEGDRNNLTLWKGGDALIGAVAGVNPNTVVVLHTAGPVLVEEYRTHPNITAILWAGLPGQESGNAIVDILYGDVNPQGRTPFTWGKKPEDWGVELLYEADTDTPSQDLNAGLFIDYRHFDKNDIEPSFEFGFGLSYTTFEYSDLEIERVGNPDYEAAEGETGEAPVLGEIGDREDAVMPEDFEPVKGYIYSWVEEEEQELEEEDGIPEASLNGESQAVYPAGGAPGGNPGLYEVLYTISVSIENTGEKAGTEIAQLYLSPGDPDGPVRVLRGFEDVELEAGESKRVSFDLTYRDLAAWDVEEENWTIADTEKAVFVGSSSRDLRLNGTLEA